MDLQSRIDAFLAGDAYAVVGASSDRAKYGNKVLRCYLQNQRKATPINPRGGDVEGLRAYASLADLPEPVHGASIITPPAVTEQIVQEALELGIRHLWMQPGAESAAAIETAQDAGANVIGGDACLLVVLGYRESV